MKTEKLAAIGLVVIIVGALSGFLIYIYKDDISDNLKWSGEKKDTGKIIEYGDCADIDFIGYFSNGSVFTTTYKDIAIEHGIYVEEFDESYKTANIFVTLKWNETVPEGYTTYNLMPIYGFTEELIDKEEGNKYTLGPIPPEKGLGLIIQVNDTVNVTLDPIFALYFPNMNEKFIEIIENATKDLVPDEYLDYVTENLTTLYVTKDISYDLGDKKTLYPLWEDATIVTKINETHRWWETKPPEDKMINFTYFDETGTYWENASTAVINKTNNSIVITHNPEKGQNITLYTTNFSVNKLTSDKVNCSFIDSDGNESFYEFDRIITITLNESEGIINKYPENRLAELFSYYRLFNPEFELGAGRGAGEILYFDIDIIKVYKTSQKS